jgi:DNA-binding SARP family transcriptional activator
MLHIRFLGEFSLVFNGVEVSGINQPRLKSLLAFLIYHREAPQSRAHLSFTFWPDSTERQAHTNLRKYLHYLRRKFPKTDTYIHIDDRSIQWRTDSAFTLDVDEFEKAINEAREKMLTDHSLARQLFEKAIAIYHGDLLPEIYDDWIMLERERLRRLMIDSLEQLVMLLEDAREYQEAIYYNQQLLRNDALHEPACRQLMRLYALRGNRAAALHTYHNLAAILKNELGVDPDAETQELFDRLIQSESTAIFIPSESGDAFQLVGREREFKHLQTVWNSLTGDRAHLVLLYGEAGIGKTRLADEFFAWACRLGIGTAAARCFASTQNLAYYQVSSWLRSETILESLPELDPHWISEISRLVPEIKSLVPETPPPIPLKENWQRQRFFEAVKRGILQKKHLILILDDLQWCDADSLDWIAYLLHGPTRTPPADKSKILILATMRDEDLLPGSKHELLLHGLRRNDLISEIELGPLSENETYALVKNITKRQHTSEQIKKLFQETKGNPLFIIETARLEPNLETHGTIPPKIQSVIEARISQISPLARRMLEVAAVIGQGFSPLLLSRVCNLDQEQLAKGLDQLWRRRIIGEGENFAYIFTHDMLRVVAYNMLSPAQKKFTHNRVAKTLEGQVSEYDLRGQENFRHNLTGQVAYHYEKAGNFDKAWKYYRKAAMIAKDLYANQEAVIQFQRALLVLERMEDARRHQHYQQGKVSSVLEQLGKLLERQGDHGQARQAFQTALSHLSLSDRIWESRLNHFIGDTYKSQGQYEDALRAYALSESCLSIDHSCTSQEYWQEWLEIQFSQIKLYYGKGDSEKMGEIVGGVQSVVERYGSTTQRASYYNLSSLTAIRQERYAVSEGTISLAMKALHAYQELNDPVGIAEVEFFLGLCSLCRNQLPIAENHLMTSLEMLEKIGDRRTYVLCLSYLSLLFRRKNQVEGAQNYATMCLADDHIDQNPSPAGLAKANLAWVLMAQGLPDQAFQHAQSALELWKGSVYPFQWTALFPLIKLAMDGGDDEKAVSYISQLLGPTQQRLDNRMNTLLEEIVTLAGKGQPDLVHERLHDTLELAQQLGYL